MHIFIDSNILYQDYFFNNKSNKKILEYAKKNIVYLYMSDVVLLELRKQFEKEIIEKIKETNKLVKDIERLKLQDSIKIDIRNINVDDQLENFDNFYDNLSQSDSIEIINYRNDYLPDLVDRAINRKKPFSENKMELKDAIIWKSYSDYVEVHALTNCIFLTNNTSDFCEKDNKYQIHKDLQKDTNRLKVINSSFEFVKQIASSIETPEYKFILYIEEQSFDNAYVLRLIKENFIKEIKDYIYNKVDHLHPMDILKRGYPRDGQIMSYDTEIINCDNVQIEILTRNALISGTLVVRCETEILEYDSNKEVGEDSFSSVSEKTIIFVLTFNFDFYEQEVCDNFEITYLKIINVY